MSLLTLPFLKLTKENKGWGGGAITLSTDQEITDMHCPSVITQNERKYVPIQASSPVALAGSDVQKRKIELNCGTVILTSSPCVKKVKVIAARKKENRS
jgi:hypothetical protein